MFDLETPFKAYVKDSYILNIVLLKQELPWAMHEQTFKMKL